MDLGFLDKSAGVTPLLVRLYDNHKLYMLAQDRTPTARAELTDAVSELLQQELSPRESELIADVLIALIRQTEKDLRQALAEKLAVLDHVPLRVILNLVNDEIDVAAAVLRNSKVLTDLDLVYIIKSKGQETWPHIAARPVLSDRLIDILSETRDFDTALSLAQNRNIVLTEQAMHILSDLAQGNKILAVPLVTREEIPQAIAKKLYKYVGEELKTYICQKYEIDRATIETTVDEIVIDFAEAPQKDEKPDFLPSITALHAATRLKRLGELTIKHMLSVLKQGQISSFIALFSIFCEIAPSHILAMLQQPGGQSLAVTCKAVGIMKADFISLYLLSNSVRNAGGVSDVYEISRAVSYYDKIRADQALAMIESFRNGKSH